MSMRVTLIAAVAKNGVIGLKQDLPWRLPPDLKRFKALTMGHTMIMGRKTFESVVKPLPGRPLIVISRGNYAVPAGVRLAHTLAEALAMAEASGETEVFVAGGGEIYKEALATGRADRLQLTRLDLEVAGDTHFPDFDPARFQLVERDRHEAGPDAPFGYEFLVYDRV
jgi:dihydrofolate reductase